MDFYYSPASGPCRAVLMTAQAIGVELNKIPVDLRKGEHLTPDYIKINPQHTVPTLVDNGFSVWDSHAIMIYLVEQHATSDSLYPACPQKRGLINQRLYFDVDLYSVFWSYCSSAILKKSPYDPEILEKLKKQLELFYTLLAGNEFAVGGSLTLADLSLLATVTTLDVFSTLPGFEVNIKQYSNIEKWYENMKNVAPGYQQNLDNILAIKQYFVK
ncbi:glutathione S-transferase 1-1-like [Bactrocera tryoni]|uniref:glutathione S-transferase 1-1-like n=1 Tax=Bactrocera tryoni TaxID=59916 RepID=UPI001A96B2AA|nr:glutathione S-transferase 1-1-like [Bactrocera tryoni]